MKKSMIGLGVLAILLSCVLIAGAAPATVTLPNGAALEVTIGSPATCTEYAADDTGSRDIDVSGTASVGLGDPDATLIYVVDVSGSTDAPGSGGTGCAPILDCEKKFVKALNEAAIASGSVDEVGTVVFANSAQAADMSPDAGEQVIIAPYGDSFVTTVVDSIYSVYGGNGGVGQYANKVAGVETYCTAALQQALAVAGSSTNSNNIVVMVSDGLCDNIGGGGIGAFNTAITDLANAGVVVNTIAAGSGSSCNGAEPGFTGTLQMIADGTGGVCVEVADPGQLPSIIPDLVSTSLDSLGISVDGGAATPIATIPALPQPGAISVNYATTVTALLPGDHTIAVTATGSDVVGSDSVTESVTIHVFDLTLTPASATNELGTPGQDHTVTATIAGADIAGRTVNFEVYGGPNTGAAGSCLTGAAGSCDFTYTAVQGPAGLGTDNIRATVDLADPTGEQLAAEATKDWIDMTPPAGACSPGPNPAGKVPPAKGGQRPDGFYALTATDAVDPSPSIFVVDTGTGTVFGPFTSVTNIKYTQAPGATPVQKPMSGVVAWHITGQGDAGVYAVDASGNVQDPQVSCLVPPPPK